ncbi:hypothetical protein PHYBLDRAFT_147509 [Phycomyces blakesleeanus NRRL 1555(-)]|uniref:Uncharacterized protein n=1 Tax=Phycomyces blakesleeanus (strain ATCC 8743b / DSM 1359 / FGSC 10004 / NBRC 33097 / NRRL 1555) TaxID=763407 RepID=A0A163DJS0_PHYB8|nr:hypothetical protein PHYBLDRAFT_147509 [Phycomyces blakesleeanus NRRL 1555(-)]OAD71750.1 hypothetical protein PHYBLDRAFT_147509 [Phycomyces blakesleeanus NRRL 1555(-)]|eukprot:XP_018289790.1 hypothetical protein PHYBLDRAFT_147509 [Phycomyces blakesleeanus NRRL 1555(-)]
MFTPASVFNIDKCAGSWDGVNASIHNYSIQSLVHPNKTILLFTSPGSEVLFNRNATVFAWARGINPVSAVFSIGKMVSKDEFYELMTRQKATTDVTTVKGSQIIAFSGFSSDSNIIKVHLYNISACQVEIDLCDPLIHAIEPYSKVIYVCAYVAQYGQLHGKAAVFLNISALSLIHPLQSLIYIGECFNASILTCFKTMLDYCCYCQQEEHLILACSTCSPHRF